MATLHFTAYNGKYKKKNIDIFILETSKEKFNSVGEKLSAIAKEVGAKFDYTTLSEENLTNLTDNFEEYYEEHLKESSLTDIATNLTEKFFEIKRVLAFNVVYIIREVFL